MSNITFNIIYDRKHTATAKKAASVEIRVTFQRKQKYFSTGVRVCANEWDKRNNMVRNRPDMVELNDMIEIQLRKLRKAANKMLEEGVVELSELGRMAEASQNGMSFFEYVLKRANERIVKDSTRKRYMVFLNTLKEYGKIRYFSDLTEGSIRHFDEWLHHRYGSQNTIRDYHKHMKEFVNDAMRDGLLKSDPYLRFKVKRGRPASDKFISPEEVAKIESLDLQQQSLKDARDLFLLQCYTGIAYADLVLFDPTKIVDGLYVNKRDKTGVEFYAPIKDKALTIIKRMAPDGVWPKIPCNQKYNEHLKLIASYARIDKPLSSHWARRTAGNWMVNEGISMETVQKVLGHASIKQTEEVYAHLNEDSVRKAFGLEKKKE